MCAANAALFAWFLHGINVATTQVNLTTEDIKDYFHNNARKGKKMAEDARTLRRAAVSV